MKIFLDWLLEQITKVNMATFITGTYRLVSLALIAYILTLLLALQKSDQRQDKAIQVLINKDRNNTMFEIHKRSLKKEEAARGGRGVNPSSQKLWKNVCLSLIQDNDPMLEQYAFDRSRTLGESCAVLVKD
jgi:hypothetical protein